MSSSLRRIAGWFRRWPDGNLGIATGGGIIAVDVDPRSGGTVTFERLIARHGALPPTAEALTGSGGWHYLFRVPATHLTACKNHWRPGIDIKGERGYIVVAPSIHPVSGKEYAWIRPPGLGIATAPRWLLRLLPKRQAPLEAPGPAVRPLGWRGGCVAQLLSEMEIKFPVPAYGYRYKLMVRAVGSLVGREYEKEVVVAVLMGWWEHFFDRSTIRTDRLGMERELAACLRSTCRNDGFSVSKGDEWHRARCRRIRLNARQRRLLRSPAARVGVQVRLAHPTRKSVTRIGDRLCNSADEEFFVEALIVHITHKRADLAEDTVLMTDNQIRQIAVERREAGWAPWRNMQIERLKAKYITRPGKPATRRELFRVIQTGQPRRGQQPSKPSEYQATGIEELLEPEAPESTPGSIVSADCASP